MFFPLTNGINNTRLNWVLVTYFSPSFYVTKYAKTLKLNSQFSSNFVSLLRRCISKTRVKKLKIYANIFYIIPFHKREASGIAELESIYNISAYIPLYNFIHSVLRLVIEYQVRIIAGQESNPYWYFKCWF